MTIPEAVSAPLAFLVQLVLTRSGEELLTHISEFLGHPEPVRDLGGAKKSARVRPFGERDGEPILVTGVSLRPWVDPDPRRVPL